MKRLWTFTAWGFALSACWTVAPVVDGFIREPVEMKTEFGVDKDELMRRVDNTLAVIIEQAKQQKGEQ